MWMRRRISSPIRQRSRRRRWTRWSDLAACSTCALLRRTQRSGPTASPHADPGGPEGEILLLSVGWDRRRDYRTPAFWRESPWLTREAAEWLYARKPTAVAFDFPQDYPIRLLLDGKSAPNDQQVTHDVLLNNGITLIEYLVNTTAL